MAQCTLKEFCNKIGIHFTTFYYQLKQNAKYYKNGLYPVLLSTFITVKVKQSGYKFHFIKDVGKIESAYNDYRKWLDGVKEERQKRARERVQWTQSAIDCWLNKGNCLKCNNNFICRKNEHLPYPMHNVVKTLLATVGEPMPEQLKDLA